MHLASLHAFFHELDELGALKLAGAGWENAAHGAELAGLGVLAHGSAKDLQDPEASEKEKKRAKKELAGLGILGIPAAIHLGHAAYQKLRNLPRAA